MYAQYLAMIQDIQNRNERRRRTPLPHFERAVSGRATCRTCSLLIAKDTCRLGSPVWYARRQTYTNYWFHLGCIRVVRVASRNPTCAFCSSSNDGYQFFMPDETGCGASKANSYFCFNCLGKKTKSFLDSDDRVALENKIIGSVPEGVQQQYLEKMRAGWRGVNVSSSSSSSSLSSHSSSSSVSASAINYDDVEVVTHKKGAEAVAGSTFLGYDLEESQRKFQAAAAAGNIICLDSDDDDNDDVAKPNTMVDDEVLLYVVKPQEKNVSSASSTSSSSSSASSSSSFSSYKPYKFISIKVKKKKEERYGMSIVSLDPEILLKREDSTSNMTRISDTINIVIESLNNPAALSTLQIHDTIVKVNQQVPRDMEHFISLIRQNEECADLEIKRRASNRIVRSKPYIRGMHTVVQLKKLLVNDHSRSIKNCKAKDDYVNLYWNTLLRLEMIKDNLISVIMQDSNATGTTRDVLISRCDFAYIKNVDAAIQSGVNDGTFITGDKHLPRYKLKTIR
jgi:hypothetical protein